MRLTSAAIAMMLAAPFGAAPEMHRSGTREPLFTEIRDT
jgi:hypothetical protein